MAAQSNVPPLLDLTIDNITPNTNRINSQCKDQRLTYLMSRLVTHLHDFARETRLSSEEWMAALNFLVGCGQISNDVRHVSLSDLNLVVNTRRLGLSTLCHTKPQSYEAPESNWIFCQLGVHPTLRCPRPFPPCRQHQPPQAARVDRGLGPGPLPHPRRADPAQRLRNVIGSRR